jgi:hypothetical protein
MRVHVPAELPVCTILFQDAAAPEERSTAMETTADGMAEAIDVPTRRLGYILAAAVLAAGTTAKTSLNAVSCGVCYCG